MRSVLVASKDEAHVVRQGVRSALEREPGIAVVGEASTGSDLLRLADELRPDVVAAGLDYPDMSAIEVIRQLRQSRADLGILVVTVFEDVDHILDAIDAGADGYLLVSTPVEALVSAIRSCTPGQFTLLDPTLARQALAQMRRREADPSPPLSPAEITLLTYLSQGRSNKEIAALLGRTLGTVRTDLWRLYQRIGVADRTQAALWAVRHGYAAAFLPLLKSTPGADEFSQLWQKIRSNPGVATAAAAAGVATVAVAATIVTQAASFDEMPSVDPTPIATVALVTPSPLAFALLPGSADPPVATLTVAPNTGSAPLAEPSLTDESDTATLALALPSPPVAPGLLVTATSIVTAVTVLGQATPQSGAPPEEEPPPPGVPPNQPTAPPAAPFGADEAFTPVPTTAAVAATVSLALPITAGPTQPATPAATATRQPSNTPRPTDTPVQTSTPTMPLATVTPTPLADTPTASPLATETPALAADTPTASPLVTETPAPPPTAANTPVETPEPTGTPTVPGAPTASPSPSAIVTPTGTPLSTPTVTPSAAPSPTATPIAPSPTPPRPPTPSSTPTPACTPSNSNANNCGGKDTPSATPTT